MQGMLTVFHKEVVDNLRDRRTLVSALVFGPLLGPVVFALMLGLVIDRAIGEADQRLGLAVIGAERAPNLMQYLREQGVDVLPPPAEPQHAVQTGSASVVLEVPEDYADAFRAGRPASVRLMVDRSRAESTRKTALTGALLQGYGRRIGALRLQVRGVNPLATVPLVVEEIDLSTPTARSAIVLGVIPLFLLITVLMGSMNVAIDSTAGERERKSLEPLLTLPVERSQLVLGKLAAACVFAAFAVALCVLAFGTGVSLLPLEKLDMVANFDATVMLATLLVVLPLVPISAAALVAIASFTRSFKEAQTYLSLLILLAMVPGGAAMLFPITPTTTLMAVPFLSQNLLVTELLKGDTPEAAWVLSSTLGSLGLAVVLVWLAIRLYRREALLG
jgi:sodium transport system permease protein